MYSYDTYHYRKNCSTLLVLKKGDFVIPQRSESSKSITMVPLPSEGGESKVR